MHAMLISTSIHVSLCHGNLQNAPHMALLGSYLG
jgi:hypothetical protein